MCIRDSLGTIAALDLVVADAGYLSALAPRLTAFYRDRGVLLRPLGNSVYVMPPYCCLLYTSRCV